MTGREFDAWLVEGCTRVEEFLDKALPPAAEPPARLHEGMRYAVFSPGKRVRPALAFGTAIACGREPDLVLPLAAAVEMVHAYSLVHDDLPAMDDDDERRGRASVHVAFGEANGILIGDALLALAFEELARSDAPAPVLAGLAQAASICRSTSRRTSSGPITSRIEHSPRTSSSRSSPAWKAAP